MSMNVVVSHDRQLKPIILNTILGNKNISRHCLVENIGVEPMTSCVQGRRSSQLS